MLSVEREPAVSGTFYSSNPKELKNQLKECFRDVQQKVVQNIAALIVPHAGYTYSGKVAASAYSLIPQDVEYENIFVIGSSHHVSFNGASVYNKGHYKTPLGVVPVNLKLANSLIDNNKCFVYNDSAHVEEHTIEVQLPFLQYCLKGIKQIVPIIVGVKSYEVCQCISEVLMPFYNERNLFIISTDFSHYPTDEIARHIDSETVIAICSNDPQSLIKALEINSKRKVKNLYTGLCGWSSVLTLLFVTSKDKGSKFVRVKYMTSAESAYKDKSRVVGYQSIVVKREDGNMLLTKEEGHLLLNVARSEIIKKLKQSENDFKEKIIDKEEFNLLDSAFVSVYVKDELRGCIGRFSTKTNLIKLIKELSISAAFEDSRFKPLLLKEIKDLKLEISVLTPMRKIKNISEIELGKHGVYLEKDGKKGTFLPQVASKTNWNLTEFLGHLARDKARVGWDGWQGANLYVFEALVYKDKEK